MQLSLRPATVRVVLRHTNREEAALTVFWELASDMIGEYDGFGLVREDNTFRGPSPSSYMMTARVADGGKVVLRIQRRDLPWRREVRIAANDRWQESTNCGPVEHASAHFPSEQEANIKRLFEDMRSPR